MYMYIYICKQVIEKPLCTCYFAYGRRKKKFPFTVRTTGRVIPFRSVSVLFPFNFHAVAVLVRFQTVPVLSQRQPPVVRSGEWPVRRN